VEDDLARHYRFGESILLALTGYPPDPPIGLAFEIVLTFLSPLAVTEAPTHAAVLAQACAGSTAAVTGTAAVALAEHARWLVARHAPTLAWLEGARDDELPEIARALDDDDRSSVGRLRALLIERAGVQLFDRDFGRDAALLAVLRLCGVRRAEQMEIAIVASRLCTSVAEALAGGRGALREYPLNLPPFVYGEDAR